MSPTFYSSVLAVCDLLKKPDLEAVTGLRYRDGADMPTFAFATLTGVTKCVYRPEGRFGPGRAPVVGAVVYSYADEVLAAQKPLFEKIGIEQVSGVGDEAFWVPAANELYSLVDEKILGMHVPASGFEADEDLKERSRRLALKAIERLR